MKKALKPSYRLADKATLTLGLTVLEALMSNTHFPTPAPALAAVQAAQTAYTEALGRAQYGGRTDRADKNAKKQALISLLRELCDHVNGVAKGSELMLATCGYPLSKQPHPQVLGTPELKVKHGASGELISSTRAVPGCRVYRHQFTTDAGAVLWPEVVSSRAACKIAGLVPGQAYSLRIIAVGSHNQSTSSAVVTKMVA